MNRKTAFAALLMLWVYAGEVSAAGSFGEETELRAAYSSLDNNSPDWKETFLHYHHFFDLLGGADAEWHHAERYGLTDDELSAALAVPLVGDWVLNAGGNTSPGHHFLPQYGYGVGLAGPLVGGWAAGAGLRRSRYTDDSTVVANGSIEYYWSNFRAVYALYRGSLVGEGFGVAHLLEMDRYYGNDNQIGLAVAAGKEPSRISPAAVIINEVRSVVLLGRHWLTRQWGLSYSAGRYDQRGFYTRDEIQLGLVYRF